MNEPLGLASALVAGVLLGAFFFGGLWWTVRKGLSSKRVALWFLGSLLLRMSVTLTGFYVISGRQLEAAAAVSPRVYPRARDRKAADAAVGRKPSHPVLEGSHAP